MTFATGTASDLEDLLSKLNTFATSTHGGWTGYTTNPDTTNRWFELHKGSLSFSMRYPASVGDGDSVSIHQATGFINDSTAPGAHTNDSGNGYNVGSAGLSSNFETERCVRDIGNGPFPSYYFFADDTGSKEYIYVVVEISTGIFRHFGMGILNKEGDNWTGGEFVYGHYHDTSSIATAIDTDHNLLLDGLGTSVQRSATMRIASGLLNQGSSTWAVVCPTASPGTDTGATARQKVHGGYRAGLEARGFGIAVGNASSGYIPMYSIGAYYKDPSNARVQKLGYMDDVRALNIRNFTDPGQEISDGSDTWVIFPMSSRTTASVANRSLYSGIAYKKVV